MIFFKKKETIRERGFTIVEALITVSIIAIMSTVYLTNYRISNQKIILDQAVAGAVADLRLAQSMAMNVKKFGNEIPLGGYGINIAASSPGAYIIYADCDNNHGYQSGTTPCAGGTASEKINDRILEKGVNVSAVTKNNIVFQPPNPIVWADGVINTSVSITLKYGISGPEKTITINGFTGQITAN